MIMIFCMIAQRQLIYPSIRAAVRDLSKLI